MKLLLVEDDELLGEGLCVGLKQNGYIVSWFQDGLSALQALKTESFDFIILDLGLPELSGLTLLKKTRELNINCPIIILTARETIEDRIQSLDSGADDYLIKPFDLNELCARLRAMHRRFLHHIKNNITYKNITLDPERHIVKIQEEEINLARREFTLLQKLLENVGHVISREQLSQSLYGWEEEIDSNALEVHIHNLRKKFGTDFIRTVRGIGYIIESENKKS